MSKEKQIIGTETIRRLSYEEYGISKERLAELRSGCRAGIYPSEMLSDACNGFEFVRQWILLSVTKNRSYDLIEYSKWGRIPCGRSNFYSFRRRFYYNLDCLIKTGHNNAPCERED